MIDSRPCRFCLAAILVALFSTPLLAQHLPGQLGVQDIGGESPAPSVRTLAGPEPTEPGRSDEAGVEYATRGPLHESYAEPYAANPQPSPIVPKEPPQPIKELPPTLKPESDNSTWIPGYWDWDLERGDFIWISGVWREVPPRRRWIPGYWEQVEGGYRRISGLWASDESETIEYLPLPPETLEQGPSSPAPGDDYFYVPGNWSYQTSEYQWTPGFWARCQPDWVWTPNQYVWTPRGCIFRSGYWDYRFHRRGILFTPVFYRSPIYLRPNYWYRPRYVVNSGLELLVHLFVNPHFGRYYFGDYYGLGHGGFYPWVSYFGGPRRYDPLFSYHGIRSIDHRGFSLDRIARGHQFFRENKDLRPPHTYAAQLRSRPQHDVSDDFARMRTLGRGLEDVADRNPAKFQFRRLSESQASSLARQTGQSQDRLQRSRKDFERLPPGQKAAKGALKGGRPATPPAADRAAKFRLPGGNASPSGGPSMSGRDRGPRGRSDVPFERGQGSLKGAPRSDHSGRSPSTPSYKSSPGRSSPTGPPPAINRGNRGKPGGSAGTGNRGGGDGRGRGKGGGGRGGKPGKGRGR